MLGFSWAHDQLRKGNGKIVLVPWATLPFV
jgi:hypothetical protein